MEESEGMRQIEGPSRNQGAVRYARPALIVSTLVAVVCIALLVVIFFLDAFNATVYSMGGDDISGDTQEARDIRGLYDSARAGSIAVLVPALLIAAVAAVVSYRNRASASGSGDGAEDADFDDLGR